MELSALLVTFGTIFLVELPDKTFLATLVLSTRYRPLLVWIGVGLAFTVQTGVAVLLGQAVSFLPDDLVRGLAAAMFLVGALLLLREARQARRAPAGRRRGGRGPGGAGVRSSGPRLPPAGAPCSPRSWCSSPPSGATCPSC